MQFPIINKHAYAGTVYSNSADADLAVIFEGPYAKMIAPDVCPQDMLDRMGLGDRLSSVHVVCPYQWATGKTHYPVGEMRKGWARVLLEIEVICPNVKRVLVVCQSALLTQVIMPGVKALADTHGTIFTLPNGLEVVPTWRNCYDHMVPWKLRDIERFKTVVKGSPLPYTTQLPPVLPKHIIIDLETTGLNSTTDTITVLGVQWSDNDRALISNNIPDAIDEITYNVINHGMHVTFHGGQFDMGFMGQEFRDAVTWGKSVHCTMMRSRARGELVNTLKHLGNHYTDRPGNYAWAKYGEHHDFSDPAYVCEDLDVTWQLSKIFAEDGNRPVVQLMEQCIVMGAEQTLVGSRIDEPQLEYLLDKGKTDIERLGAACWAEYGVDPSKTQQLVKVLLSRGHELTKRTPAGGYALDESVCEEHNFQDILDYRHATKLDSSFIGKIHKLLRPDGTIPHEQKMMGADTGRTTMSNFNHQQASKKGPVRDLIISRFDGGQILIVDLAQAELRVLAYMANDEVFAKLFDEEDPHKANASRAFSVPLDEVTEEQRDDAKTVIFRIVYGGMPKNDGQRVVEQFFKRRFKKAFDWVDRTNKQTRIDLEITDPYGKTRNLREVKTWRGLGGVGRAGINSPIQGTASHIAMQVTYNCWMLFKKYKLRSKILFGVHDSVLGDIHPDEVDICVKLVRLAFAMLRNSTMYEVFPLAKVLPMQGELLMGPTWGYIQTNKKQLIKSVNFVICSSHDPITEDDIYGILSAG